MTGALRVASWNVNGLRACATQGLLALARALAAPTSSACRKCARCRTSCRPPLRAPRGCTRVRTRGAARLQRRRALRAAQARTRSSVRSASPHFDVEGRFLLARFGAPRRRQRLLPEGQRHERDNSRVPYKLDFYRALFERVETLRRGGLRVLVMGDFNTAHREIDLARPQRNRKTSGFLPEERAEIDRWLAAGWVDTFRAFDARGRPLHVVEPALQGARERNVGWRIDYVLASPAACASRRAPGSQPQVRGSDHCPVGIDLDAGSARMSDALADPSPITGSIRRARASTPQATSRSTRRSPRSR